MIGLTTLLMSFFAQPIEVEGMRFECAVEGEEVTAHLAAPGTGWVAVGFNDRPGLAGARLFMARVRGGEVEVEEHMAQPPRHARVDGARVTAIAGREIGGRTVVAFRFPLEGRLRLQPGRSIHVILAYSESDDFNHHSRVRRHVQAEVPRPRVSG